MTDDLEIGLAAGLDVPTAIVLAEDNKPQRPRRAGCALPLLLGSVLVVAWWLSR